MAVFSHYMYIRNIQSDGASSIPLLIDKVKSMGMEAIAITDHGNMFGVKEFHNTAIKRA